jgi:multicomponent Na+:H+ antiporter subunit D
MITSQFAILIIIIPLISAFIIPILGWWKKDLCYYLALAALLLSTIASIGVLITVIETGTVHYRLGGWAPPMGIEYAIDHLSAVMAVLLTVISLNVAIYSKTSVDQELTGRTVPFYSIYLLLVTGLLGIVLTGDLFNLYVFLEVASLTAYGLIGLGDDKAPLASFRYVIMGTIGACFYLLGVGFLYIITGSLNMADVAERLPEFYSNKVILVAFAFFIVGIGIKMAVFPMHAWLPDAYTHAPSAVSAFIAPTMTKVAAYALIRIMFTVFKPYFSIELFPFTTILAWLGVIAMIIGSIYAIRQRDLKRMLAYSSIAQIGYILLGIGLANRLGLTGGLLHILNHAFMKGCLFMVAGAIIYKTGVRDIYQFKDLYRKMPYTMTAFTIAALSMIGIPPTGGFFSKLYLILGSINSGQWVFVAVILFSSILNVIYFTNVIKNAYFGPPEEELDEEAVRNAGKSVAMDEVPLVMRVPILVMAAVIILLGVFNGPIISIVLDPFIPTGIP